MAVQLTHPAAASAEARPLPSSAPSAAALPRWRTPLLEGPFRLCDQRVRRATARLFADRVEFSGRMGLRRYHRLIDLADVLYAVPRGDGGLLLQLRGGQVFFFAVDDPVAWQRGIEDHAACLAA